MISIKAPLELQSGGIWSGTGWMELDVDRVDFSVNNDVRVYPQIDEETSLNQLEASKWQMIVTGHITSDSDLVGSDVKTKAKNLILAMRQWYVDLDAEDASGFPQIKWDSNTYDYLPQKTMIIDTAEYDGDLVNYQIGTILIHDR